MNRIFITLIFGISLLAAQSKDSTIIFSSPDAEILAPVKSSYNDGWGVDILLSNNGFGFAGFYRHQYSRELAGTVALGIAESKDDNEVEYFDYWGQSYIPGKVNRFLMMPVMFGAQYRLFADDITDSFRPYINGGVGPTVVLASPYEKEFFNSLGYGQAHYTVGGYIGFGAYFGSDPGSLSGINIRYYYIPFSNGINSLQDPDILVSPGPGESFTPYYVPGKIRKKSDFGGFFITINLGSAF